MIDRTTLLQHIPQALTTVDVEWPHRRERGKVRDIFFLPGDRRLIVTTDRLSAFDRVLAAVPFKGQVLNQLSAFWFERTADLIPNHILDVPDPNVSLVRDCEPLPVEVVVRGYISGVTKTSLWTLYAAGERTIYGHTLPDGLRKDDPLPEPLITPTTKAGPGQHDQRLTCAEVVERGLLDADTWEQVQAAALAIFGRGQAVAREAGFVLVDTKYEFGRAPDGTLTLIDEVHTPDSSRFWQADDLAQAQKTGGAPEPWDKEFVRLWYNAQDYRGAGEPPALPEEIVAEAARRYIALYEGLTGRSFQPETYPAAPRVADVLETFLEMLAVIILGSPSDDPLGGKITQALERFGIPWEMRIASAHKSPGRLLKLLERYEADPRPKVYVTVAGRSNALSGLVDAHVSAPVIACPPYSDKFAGGDLLSSLRVPSGVAPAVVLEPGNAALLAAKMLGLTEPTLRQKVRRAQEQQRQRLLDADAALQE